MTQLLHGETARLAFSDVSTTCCIDSGQPTVPELSIANRLFGDRTTKFEQPFLDVTSKDYQAPVESVDFRDAYDAARKHINDWSRSRPTTRSWT